jgi:hypothetical protein
MAQPPTPPVGRDRLKVATMFEPSRIATDCLAHVYETVVPLPRARMLRLTTPCPGATPAPVGSWGEHASAAPPPASGSAPCHA